MREFMQIKFKIRQNRVTENRSVPHPPITGGLTWNYLWKGGTWELSGPGTHVSCVGRQILYHGTTREAWSHFLMEIMTKLLCPSLLHYTHKVEILFHNSLGSLELYTATLLGKISAILSSKIFFSFLSSLCFSSETSVVVQSPRCV